MEHIKDLKSVKVFEFFEEISKIPRASFKEKAISNYLLDFAKKRNLEATCDDVYNVIIKKNASKGYESSKTIAIQGHTDMVCEKNKGISHDFDKDPIQIIYDGDIIRANETTLGADNGVAVAISLAILDSDDIAHPPLEMIFTACEESGMEGVSNLDVSNLKCETLLNIDSEEEGVFTVGCAGGIKVNINLPITYTSLSSEFTSLNISVSGLLGGHSGIDVDKNRGNSNILLARALNILINKFDMYIASFDGGAKDNAIPRDAEAIVSINLNDVVAFNNEVNNICEIFKSEYKNTDNGVILSSTNSSNIYRVFDKVSSKNTICAIINLPNGIHTMSFDIKGLAESSTNIGVVITNDNNIEIIASIRSANTTKKEFLMEKVKTLIDLMGGSYTFRGNYPAWEYRENSKAREKCLAIYKSMYGIEGTISIIHAGLECGLLSKKMPYVDMVSFGPNLYDIHTPKERASISSINKIYTFVLEILKELK